MNLDAYVRPGVRYALLATFFFSLMQIGVKFLDRLPALEIVFSRAIIALLLSFVMIKKKGLNPLGNNKKLLIMRGLSGSVALILFFYSIKAMPLATAVMLQYLSPIFTIFFSIFLLKENATAYQWLAFSIAIVGVVLVKGFDSRVSLLNVAIGVTSALFSGLAYNFVRKLKDYDDPLIVVFYFPLVTVPVTLPFLINSWIWPTWKEGFLLIFVGFCVQGAQIFMTKAYQMEKAANITIFNYTGLIYALVFGYLIFGEAVEPLGLLGMAVVVFAVYMGSSARKEPDHIGQTAKANT